METNNTPTPTTIPIVVEIPEVDLSEILENQQAIILGQQTLIETTRLTYLETQLIAVMIFLGFMWKWIKRLFMKRRKLDD